MIRQGSEHRIAVTALVLFGLVGVLPNSTAGEPAPKPVRVAVLLYDGVEILELIS